MIIAGHRQTLLQYKCAINLKRPYSSRSLMITGLNFKPNRPVLALEAGAICLCWRKATFNIFR